MRILLALIKKEFKQIVRDPSTILIAFVLPIISILIYMYGLNLDSVKITMGVLNNDPNPEISTLVKSFSHSKYIKSVSFDNENEIRKAVSGFKIKGAIIIPNDFSVKLSKGQQGNILVITDGSEANTANYVQNYATSIINQWFLTSKFCRGKINNINNKGLVNVTSRAWYNPDLNSHNFILPGSIAITMNLIGILLTSLVIAREWERGTMETLLSTSIKPIHIVLGKYIPYFCIGMIPLIFNILMCIFFKIPFRGSYFVLFGVSSLFLLANLGIGLTISTVYKNQLLASMMSLSVGFMPAAMLSGLMFPIDSMPVFFQHLTRVLPPRYYISFVESEYMAGGVNEIRIINTLYLLLMAVILFIAVYKNIATKLEDKNILLKILRL